MKKTICLAALISTISFPGKIFAQPAKDPCYTNMVISAEKGKEGAIVYFPTQGPAGEKVDYFPVSGSFFRLGSHSITGVDQQGKKCHFTLTVTDNEAPELTPIKLSADRYWEATNRMKKVVLTYDASDNSQSVINSLQINSNAGTEGRDYEILNNKSVRLLSATLLDGSPRVYTITVSSADQYGNKTTRSTQIVVNNRNFDMAGTN